MMLLKTYSVHGQIAFDKRLLRLLSGCAASVKAGFKKLI